MIVPGCLLALALPLLGVLLGHWLGGEGGAFWGLGVGLVLGLLALAGAGWLLVRLRRG